MTQARAPGWIGNSLAASAGLLVLWTAWNLRASPLSVALTGAAGVLGAMAIRWSLRAPLARVLAFSAIGLLASRLLLTAVANQYGAVIGSLVAALVLGVGTVRALIAIGPKAAGVCVTAGKWLAPLILLQTAGLICSPQADWLFLSPTAHLSVDGARNAGYVHYFGTRASGANVAVTIRKAGQAEAYWLVLPRGHRLSAWRCDDWTAPALPFLVRGDLSPPCSFENEPGKARPNRHVQAGDGFVEFTTDDGRRVKAKWNY